MTALTSKTYDYQPLHKLIKDRRLTFPALAFAIGLRETREIRSLRHVAYGVVYPSPHMVKALPEFFGVPLSDLFTERVLDGVQRRERRELRENRESRARPGVAS